MRTLVLQHWRSLAALLHILAAGAAPAATEPADAAPRLMVQAAAGGVLGVQIAAADDGRLLASTDPQGGEIQVWDRASGRVLCVLAAAPAPGRRAARPPLPMSGAPALAFSSAGDQLVSAAAQGLQLWDLRRCQLLRSVPAPAEVVQILAVAGGRQLLLDAAGKLWLSDTFTAAQPLRPWALGAFRATGLVSTSRDGSQVLVKALGSGGPLAGPEWLRLDLDKGSTEALSTYQGVDAVKGFGALGQTATLSPSGRWIALHAAGRLQLLDAVQRRQVAATGPAASPAAPTVRPGGPLPPGAAGGTTALPMGDMRAAMEAALAMLPPEARARAREQVAQTLGQVEQIGRDLEQTAQSGALPDLLSWIGFSPDERQLIVWRSPQPPADGPQPAQAGSARSVLAWHRLPDLAQERESTLREDGAAAEAPAPMATGFAATPDRRWLVLAMATLDGGGARLGALDLAAAAPRLRGWRPAAGGAAQLHWRDDDRLVALQAPQAGGSAQALAGRGAARPAASATDGLSARAVSQVWNLRDGAVVTHAVDALGLQLPRSHSPGGHLVAMARVEAVDLSRAQVDLFIDVLDASSLSRQRAVRPLDGSGRALVGFPDALALSDDGRLLAALGLIERDDGQSVLSLHDAVDGRLLAQLPLPFAPDTTPGGEPALRLAADKRRLAIRGHGGEAASIDLTDPRRPLLTPLKLPTDVLAIIGTAPLRWLVAQGRRSPAGGKAGGMDIVAVAADQDGAAVLSTDAQLLATAGRDGSVQIRRLAADGTIGPASSLPGLGAPVRSLAISPDRAWLAGSAANGSTGLWNLASGSLVLRLYAFGDGRWATVDRDGRFDTNRIEDLESLHWVTPAQPLQPLPLEVFMQAYFQPGLLARSFAGEALAPVADLRRLNTAQPDVAILSIQPTPGRAGHVDVEVEAIGGRDSAGREGGVADLRLFRDGRLVAPPAGTRAPAAGQRQRLRYTAVRLPSGAREVMFSAYAFNHDRVKSATAQRSHRAETPAVKGRAYLVAIGVNRHDVPSWDLDFAVNDARATSGALQARLAATGAHAEVIAVPLLADGGTRTASKEAIRAVLGRLAGGTAALPAGVDAGRLQAATPDDLVVVSFAGHGLVDAAGQFQLLPQDAHGRGDPADRPSRGISADELADWLGAIDAGELSVVIDACQSAASVDRAGFRPGPLGSRGLGQLAYDKGARLLAATQVDNVAIEYPQLRHGLLTFALVRDGLDSGHADFRPADRQISLGEWLAYGAQRVPGLQADVLSGRLKGRGMQQDGVGANGSTGPAVARPVTQQPRLFDFAPDKDGPLLLRRP